jgi:pesticin/yersiniabactin receptor
MHNNSPKLSIVAGVVLAILGSTQSFADETSQAMEVVVVEATKFDTPLSQVNNSVIIKTGEELEKAGIYQVQDLERVFPGLLIQTRGNRTYANTTVRGISSPDYYSPTVSVYVDGVLQDSAFVTQPLINVERVELLRGPQGTLYGGNAQGGVINIVTRKETETTELKTSAVYSNLSQQIDAAAATRLSDSVSADIAASYVYDEGNIKHVSSGKEDVNDADESALRVRFHYLPNDSKLTASLSIAADKLDSHEEWYLTQDEFDSKTKDAPIPNLKRDVYTYAFNLGYDFGRSQLTSITAYQTREIDREYVYGNYQEDQDKLSQELRLNLQHSDKLHSVIGGYFETRNLDVTANGANNKLDYDTYALFGQTNYQFASQWDLTLGARASHLNVSSDFSGNPAWFIDPYNNDLSESTISPKAAIGWQANQQTRIYASVTSGYRPAGYNVVPLSNADAKGYDAEKSLNGELGWRTSFAEQKVAFSGAIYWIKTEDIHLYTGTPGNQTLNNMGEALSKGVEAELAFYPTDDLTITAAGTYGRSTFESNNSSFEGNTLPYAPDTTATLGIDYYLPISAIEGDISINSQARYNSKIYFNEANSLSQIAYTLVDLSINYQYNPHLSVSLFSNNITDKEYTTYAFTYGQTYSNYGTGREVGVKAKYEW